MGLNAKGIVKKYLFVPFFFIGLSCIISTEAFGSSPDTPAQSFAWYVVGFGVLFGIAYLTRRRAIGGWLLVFYIQLYMGLAAFLPIGFLAFPEVISNFNPAKWNSAKLYVLFVLTWTLLMATPGLVVFAGTRLLFEKSEKNLLFLKKVLFAWVAAIFIFVAIYPAYFSNRSTIVNPEDVFLLFYSVIWCLYFLKSRRVRLVFIEKAWDYAFFRKKVPFHAGS